MWQKSLRRLSQACLPAGRSGGVGGPQCGPFGLGRALPAVATSPSSGAGRGSSNTGSKFWLWRPCVSSEIENGITTCEALQVAFWTTVAHWQRTVHFTGGVARGERAITQTI